jgi:hypothetical protein
MLTFSAEQFYEIVDTAIILAKGKKVSSLQEYHHFGEYLAFSCLSRSATNPFGSLRRDSHHVRWPPHLRHAHLALCRL